MKNKNNEPINYFTRCRLCYREIPNPRISGGGTLCGPCLRNREKIVRIMNQVSFNLRHVGRGWTDLYFQYLAATPSTTTPSPALPDRTTS